MAQEGIATLPQSPENQAVEPDINVIKQSIGQRIPGAEQAYDQTMNQVSSQINLPVDQLQIMLQILQYMLSNEQQYAQIRQKLLTTGKVRPKDLPEQFDRGYLTTMLLMVQETLKRKSGTSPMAQMPQPQGFARGGLAGAAQSLAAKGRGGDTILAHINPQEAMMLKAMGGSGTINPATGLMEFKGGPIGWVEDAVSSVGDAIGGAAPSVGDFIGGAVESVGDFVGDAFQSVGDAVQSVAESPVGKVVMTVALGVALGPAGLALMPAWAAGALAAGAVSMVGGNSLSDSLKAAAIGGVAGYFAPGLSDSIGSLGQTGALGQFINQGLTGATIGTGYGLISGQNVGDALKTGAVAGLTAGAVGALMPTPGTDGSAPVTDKSTLFGSDVTDGVINAPTTLTTGQQAVDITQRGGAITPTSEGINTLQQAPVDPYAVQDMQLQARSGDGIFRGIDQAAPVQIPTTYTADQQYINQGMEPQARAGEGIFRGDQATTASGSATDYLTKGKDYLFGTDPKNPGLFMNKEGGYSVPAITAGVLGIGALTGGFDSSASQSTSPGVVQRKGSGAPVTGEDLVSQNPEKYLTKNIPGFNIPAFNTSAASPTSANFVSSPMYGSGRQLPYATYTPPSRAVSANPGQPIQQPYNTAMMYDFMPRMYADGGISQVYPRRTGGINGPGTGTSDSIPAMLSDGEFVITAKAVRGAGGGSRREGAKKLYRMMHALEKKAK
jgi:hypothetical protein